MQIGEVMVIVAMVLCRRAEKQDTDRRSLVYQESTQQVGKQHNDVVTFLLHISSQRSKSSDLNQYSKTIQQQPLQAPLYNKKTTVAHLGASDIIDEKSKC